MSGHRKVAIFTLDVPSPLPWLSCDDQFLRAG